MGHPRRQSAERTTPRDHYAEITDRVIAALEAGTLPWRRPWDQDKAGAGPLSPRNAVTGRRYRGANVLVLGMSGFGFGGADPRWLTYRQAEAKGWQVRHGERGTTVFFFRRLTIRDGEAVPDAGGDGDGSTRTVPLLRAFTVFHASQVEGIPDFAAPSPEEAAWRTPEAVETIIRNSGVVFREGGDRAFYSTSTDHVQMPPRVAFASPESFAATAMHELAHASGARHRLDRDLTGRFGSHAYAQEELRAELASAFIGAELGLPCDIPNHASYVASWLRTLKQDKREIFRAAADAQRIADYLLAFHPEQARRLSEEAIDDTAGHAA
ncbi:ssDNA-binding domain-containing protein (plasmid) [Roseomonas sp. OT10]|uniref:ArdC family protein n=1 Tax=Roseomonas cutis TaxID=2897332 RepID=UPI001E54A106|nr:zincin-like metallopeptidase domain-containing protein [Roseomonas sp. OT10]UFN51683.1 ssDNA-binding domain-containing protein [Roseomonas sp. OT10]